MLTNHLSFALSFEAQSMLHYLNDVRHRKASHTKHDLCHKFGIDSDGLNEILNEFRESGQLIESDKHNVFFSDSTQQILI